ncbi:MAG: HAD family phosphatase [Bacteroidota bacterium]
MSAFGILFDMDGVIVDTNPAHNEALHQLFARRGLSYSQEEINRRAHGRPNFEWIPDFIPVQNEQDIQQIAAEKEELFRTIYQKQMKSVSGLKPLLDLLQSYDVPMAVATSAPVENVDFILDGLDFRHYFKAILHSGHISKGKPDPEIYLKAAAALHLDPKDCIVIEDSIVGVQSGLAAGATVIGISTTHEAAELKGASLVVSDFWQLGMDQLIGLLA